MTHSPVRFFSSRVSGKYLLACAGIICCLLFWISGRALAKGTAPRLPQAGFRTVGIWEPSIPLRMDVAVWYPTNRTPRDILLEGWSIQVGQNGLPVPGKYPVILLSHTTASSRLASHDLAAILARNGFMVIAPTHPKDNTDDTRNIFRAALFVERPQHLLTALEAVEKHPVLGPIMDRSRIGLLGVGAGAATVLQLAGAGPNLSRLSTHCPPPGYPGAESPLCTAWASMLHPRMQTEFATLLEGGPDTFTPTIPRNANWPENEPTQAQVAESAAGPSISPVPSAGLGTGFPPSPPGGADVFLAPDGGSEELPVQPPQGESPVLRAVGLLTPGLVDLFPDEALRNVDVPVGIFAAGLDTVYPPAKFLDRLQRLLPQRPAARVLQHAGHFDLQAPCPPAFFETFPSLCGDQGPEADTARQTRNAFFLRFFQKNLGPPLAPPEQPQP